jgi:DNA-binding NtrC family response regulator
MAQALIIEDDEATRIVLRKMLERVQIDVEEAVNGMDGLLALKRKKFDVVLLDVSMPKMNGEQVMNVLHKRNESHPIIVVSAYLTKERIMKLMQLGVKEFIHKPFNIDKFYQTINKFCPIQFEQV